MAGQCPLCESTRVAKIDGEMRVCPNVAITPLGRLGCKKDGETFYRNKSEVSNAVQQKDKAYEERNRVVAALAKAVIALGGRAGRKKTPIEGWNPLWFNCLYVEPKEGSQWSWHYHSEQEEIFKDLPEFKGEWDGHDNPEKYKRLEAWKP